jgi:hypothetical protein
MRTCPFNSSHFAGDKLLCINLHHESALSALKSFFSTRFCDDRQSSKARSRGEVDEPCYTWTITGRDAANHYPTDRAKAFGKKDVPFEAVHFDRLEVALTLMGADYERIDLNALLPPELREGTEMAEILIIPNGVNVLAGNEEAANDIQSHLQGIPYDTKAINLRSGKVCTRHAQQTTVLVDGQKFADDSGMGTLNDYLKVPHLAKIRANLAAIMQLPSMLQDVAEINQYCNTLNKPNISGVGFHGSIFVLFACLSLFLTNLLRRCGITESLRHAIRGKYDI